MMQKRLLAALLCAILLMALLPAAALAAWDSAATYTSGQIIEIDGVNYTYKGDLSNSPAATGLTAADGKTVYKAGSGKVLWNGADNKLTMDNASISNVYPDTTVFNLPGSSAEIVLVGENAITASSGSFTAFSGSSDSFTMSGSGTIDMPDGSTLISATGHVALNGGTLTGKIAAGEAELNGVTIPKNGKLDVTGTLTAASTVNNGILVLKAGTDANAIKALNLTGSGMVKVMESDAVYYTLAGEKLTNRNAALDFTKDSSAGGWKSGATLDTDGYTFTGDATSGYVLTLGNLIIEAEGIHNHAINLPNDGDVTVHLKDGTTTRLTVTESSGISFTTPNEHTYTCTINGSGKLVIQAEGDNGAIQVVGRLTIAGGDITVNNSRGPGINCSDGASLGQNRIVSITGGKLSITGGQCAISAGDDILIGSGMQITSPAEWKIDALLDDYSESIGKTVFGPDATIAKYVLIQPAPSSGGDGGSFIYTSPSATVYNDPATPNATVWLTGAGLDSSDMLITKRNPSGSAYKALTKLADSGDVIATYNIYLQSGKKSTGSAMNLTFNLNEKYAGEAFTLVHQKADSAYEYFYDTADANGDLTFGPLYELSPFMLVRGTLAQTPANAVKIPATGDGATALIWLSAALTAAAVSLAGAALYKRRRD